MEGNSEAHGPTQVRWAGLRCREDNRAGPLLVRGELPEKAGRPGCTGAVGLGTESGFSLLRAMKGYGTIFFSTNFEKIIGLQEVAKIVQKGPVYPCSRVPQGNRQAGAVSLSCQTVSCLPCL